MNIVEIKAPLVSVIMPTYNCENFLYESIESVLVQSFKNWELIVVDDASSDRSLQIARSFALDTRVQIISMRNNCGSGVARNCGINMAKGKYIAFLDSDDIYSTKKLEHQIQFMESKQLAISCTDFYVCDEGGHSLYTRSMGQESFNYIDVLTANPIGCSTVMIDRTRIAEIRFPGWRNRQDWGLWLTITKSGHLVHCFQECLTGYRIRRGSVSSNKMVAAWNNWQILRMYEKLDYITAINCFVQYVLLSVLRRISFISRHTCTFRSLKK